MGWSPVSSSNSRHAATSGSSPSATQKGSKQAGIRPVVIASRDAINAASPVILVVPCTTYRAGRRLYPRQALLHTPDGGLDVDSVALGEQGRTLAISQPPLHSRLYRDRGMALDRYGSLDLHRRRHTLPAPCQSSDKSGPCVSQRGQTVLPHGHRSSTCASAALASGSQNVMSMAR